MWLGVSVFRIEALQNNLGNKIYNEVEIMEDNLKCEECGEDLSGKLVYRYGGKPYCAGCYGWEILYDEMKEGEQEKMEHAGFKGVEE